MACPGIGSENDDGGRIVYPTPATPGEENLFSMAQSERQPCNVSIDPTNLQRIPYDWINMNSANTSQPPPGKTRTKDKYRVVYSDHQRLELEKEFHFSRYITIRRKSELAMQLSLSERQIKIWFQNRRAKERKISKKQTGSACSTGEGTKTEDTQQDHDYEEIDFSNNEDDINHVRKILDNNFEEQPWTQNHEDTGSGELVPLDVDKNSLKCYQFTRNPSKEHENAVTYNFPHTISNNGLISHRPHLTQTPSNYALHNLNVFVSMSGENNS
uniref:Caudal homeoprotein n=1 Tax=Halocynthia roretzi TaxID=7729 RepID=Q9U8Q3_HALRO|nr:caudal homeoprotein [Halocynthia roretzi]